MESEVKEISGVLETRSYGVSCILDKVALRIEKCIPPSTNDEQFNSLVSKVCRMGILSISSEVLGFEYSVDCVLRMLQKLSVAYEVSRIEFCEDFLRCVFVGVKDGTLEVSASALAFLLTAQPDLFEDEVLDLLDQCSSVDVKSDLIVKALLSSRKIVPACACSSSLFAKFLAIVGHAWFRSEGHPVLLVVMKEFVNAVESTLEGSTSLIRLFPETVRSLAMLISIPPGDMFQNTSTSRVWDSSLTALKLEMCQREDLLILMAIFPGWYDRLLQDVTEASCTKAMELIKILWLCEDEDFIQDNIKHFLTDKMLRDFT